MIDTQKSWAKFVQGTHSQKSTRENLLERELLFASQIVLTQYEQAKKENNQELMDFCTDVLQTYEDHNINGHIEWKK